EDANLSLSFDEVTSSDLFSTKLNNPESYIHINKIVNKHNHRLSVEMIDFQEKEKYPAQLIHFKDLYAAIQKFRPTSKSLSNDATLMSN
ncbi:3558_t:CDS:2, partial [Cetraspora pellucida]